MLQINKIASSVVAMAMKACFLFLRFMVFAPFYFSNLISYEPTKTL